MFREELEAVAEPLGGILRCRNTPPVEDLSVRSNELLLLFSCDQAREECSGKKEPQLAKWDG